VNVLRITSHSEAQTRELARKLAASFLPGDVVVLIGPLGAGKTVFVRGLVEGRGLDINRVHSPSFTIVNEYPGEKPLYHFDLYRLNDLGELIEIGYDDYLSRDGVVVIEWGDKAIEVLPEQYYRVEFGIVSEGERDIDISLVKS
jgi:tRNA threonylcarbamoyladenosine biosynthesis protein TsaE